MPDKPYDKWKILNVRQRVDREVLKNILSPAGEVSISSQSIFDYLMNPPKSRKLSLCRSVLVEDSYFDQDFIDSVSSFYSKSFRKIDRLCTRLHFFSSKIVSSDVIGFEILESLQDYYLGFSVIRPLETKEVGRSAIKPRREEPGTEFYTCSIHIPVNIAGKVLHIEAAPYMEQDSRVQTCSSVAIWISTTVMAYCLDYPKYTTSQIMDYATRNIVGARAGPTQGLTYEQIMQALKIMDYKPVIFDETDPFEALHQIYCYVESEIPPILLLELHDGNYHAITALGHSHKRPLASAIHISILRLGRTILKYYRSSEWVPCFYVHDDQRGIYRELRFLEANATSIRQRITTSQRNAGIPTKIIADLKKWHCPVSIKTDSTLPNIPKETIANLWGVIVPLPKSVTLTHVEAETKAVDIIRRCATRSRLKLPNNLVLRAYLTPSNRYKSKLGKRTDMSDFIRGFYQGKPMPKYLWVFEMSTATLMNVAKLDNIRIKGELILDATSNPWPTDFVAFHWIAGNNMGNLITMSQDDANIKKALSRKWQGPDKLYRPMVR